MLALAEMSTHVLFCSPVCRFENKHSPVSTESGEKSIGHLFNSPFGIVEDCMQVNSKFPTKLMYENSLGS